MSRDGWTFRWNSHVFAAPGYVIAHVNRHGSTGFGEKFAQSILNEWGDKPFEDIMKSTDYLLKKLSNVDPKRVAATGASYGGWRHSFSGGLRPAGPPIAVARLPSGCAPLRRLTSLRSFAKPEGLRPRPADSQSIGRVLSSG